MDYEAVIGLETLVPLKTKSKMSRKRADAIPAGARDRTRLEQGTESL